MGIISVKDLDLQGKRVLVRTDYNVPIDKNGRIGDDTRIVASLPTITYILEHGGMPILISHLGRPEGKSEALTLRPVADRLAALLPKNRVIFVSDVCGKEAEERAAMMQPGEILLLENVRFHLAEEHPERDPTFAEAIAQLGDLYVNDAFGTAHRAHSSTVHLAHYFPGKAAMGLLMEQEVRFLEQAMKQPKRPFYAIIGGAKVSTKIGVLTSLARTVDALFLGGCMAYTFLKAKGISMGSSRVEENMLKKAEEVMRICSERAIPLFLPKDIVSATRFADDAAQRICDIPPGIPDGYEGMDIGPNTIQEWTSSLQGAEMILWNGPVGVFEFPNFSTGTNAIAHAVADCSRAVTIVGGGDSIAALKAARVYDAITHVSTGGGASLEYIEFGTLPGIEALR